MIIKMPDYKRIYRDMIRMKYPEKAVLCSPILEKKNIGFLDIIKLNSLISGGEGKHTFRENQKLKSYDKKTIFQILAYQRENSLNNKQVALHFMLSRNTITKWKKLYNR